MNYFNAHEEQTERNVPDKGTCETKRIQSVTKKMIVHHQGLMWSRWRKLSHVDNLEFTVTTWILSSYQQSCLPLFPFRFSNRTSVSNIHLPHSCYISCPSYLNSIRLVVTKHYESIKASFTQMLRVPLSQNVTVACSRHPLFAQSTQPMGRNRSISIMTWVRGGRPGNPGSILGRGRDNSSLHSV